MSLNSIERKLPSSERGCTCLAGLCCYRKHHCFRPVPTVPFQTFLWNPILRKASAASNRFLTATEQPIHRLHPTKTNTFSRHNFGSFQMIINKRAMKIRTVMDPEIYNYSCNTSVLLAFILILCAEPAEFSPHFTH